MAKPDIGLIDCPNCGVSGAHVREASSGRAYVVCDDCSYQGFARGDAADKAMRAKIKPVAEVPPAAPKERGFFDDLASI